MFISCRVDWESELLPWISLLITTWPTTSSKWQNRSSELRKKHFYFSKREKLFHLPRVTFCFPGNRTEAHTYKENENILTQPTQWFGKTFESHLGCCILKDCIPSLYYRIHDLDQPQTINLKIDSCSCFAGWFGSEGEVLTFRHISLIHFGAIVLALVIFQWKVIF